MFKNVRPNSRFFIITTIILLINLFCWTVGISQAQRKQTDDWLILGEQANKNGEPLKAIEYYKKFLEMHKVQENNHVAICLRNIGEAYRDIGDLQSAKEYLGQAKNLFHQLDDKLNEASVSITLAQICALLGDIPKSIDYYKNSLKLAEFIEHGEGEAFVAWNIGAAYQTIGEYSAALTYYEQALNRSQEIEYTEIEGLSYVGLGEIHRDLGNLQEALQYLIKSLNFYYSDFMRESVKANILGEIADIYFRLDEPQNGLEYALKALPIFRQLNNRTQIANILRYIAYAYREIRNFTKALEYFQQAAKFNQELGNIPGEIYALGDICNIFYKLGKYDEALQYSLESLRKREQINFHDEKFVELQCVGKSYRLKGELAQALHYLQQALNAYEKPEISKLFHFYDKTDKQHGKGDILVEMAEIYAEQDNLSKAIECFEDALYIWRSLGNRSNEAAALGNLGFIYKRLENYQIALKHFEESLKLHRQLADSQNEFQDIKNLKEIYELIGDETKAMFLSGELEAVLQRFPDAEERFKKLLEEYRRAGNVFMEQWAFNSLAKIYFQQGNLLKALEYYNEVLALQSSGELINALIISLTHNDIGLIYARLNALDKALKHFQEAIAVSETPEHGENNPLRAMIVGNMATVYVRKALVELGEEALNYWKKALDLGEEALDISLFNNNILDIAKSYSILAAIYSEKGEYDRAISYNKKALTKFKELFNTKEEIRTLSNIAKTYISKNSFHRALPYAEEAVSIAEKVNDPELCYLAYDTLADIARFFSPPEQVYAYYKSAIQHVESMRSNLIELHELQPGFQEQRMSPYFGIIEICVEMNRTDKAFHFLERAKARTFLDILGNKESLFIIKDEILSQELDVDSLLTVTPLNIEQVKNTLDKDTTVLEYCVLDNMVLLWIITQSDSKFIKISITKTELIGMVRRFREQISQKDSMYTDNAKKLYNLLIKPALKDLHTPRLCIVPHLILHYLPFHALLNEKEIYLMQEYEVFYVPTSSIFKFCLERRKADFGRILAFGNPDLSLPFSESEVKSIFQFYPNTQVFLKNEATESTFKKLSSEYDIIHLACHTDLNAASPRDSALLLASDEKNDERTYGRLTVDEIIQMNIPAFLIVLSACQTNVGKLTMGDELLGLTRSFICAGAPSVMVSLWNVADASTTHFMEIFYNNLKKGRPKIKALREAQLNMINWFYTDNMGRTRIHEHPYYWAPFILIGDWK